MTHCTIWTHTRQRSYSPTDTNHKRWWYPKEGGRSARDRQVHGVIQRDWRTASCLAVPSNTDSKPRAWGWLLWNVFLWPGDQKKQVLFNSLINREKCFQIQHSGLPRACYMSAGIDSFSPLTSLPLMLSGERRMSVPGRPDYVKPKSSGCACLMLWTSLMLYCYNCPWYISHLSLRLIHSAG